MLSINWNDIFDEQVPENSLVFWKKVITLKNAAGERLFPDISLLAFTVLSFPSSNATVERVFSIMNTVKCKLRNKMILKTLNALVLIKCHFNINKICCKDFEPMDMLKRFTSEIYNQSADSKSSGDGGDNDDDIDVIRLGELM